MTLPSPPRTCWSSGGAGTAQSCAGGQAGLGGLCCGGGTQQHSGSPSEGFFAAGGGQFALISFVFPLILFFFFWGGGRRGGLFPFLGGVFGIFMGFCLFFLLFPLGSPRLQGCDPPTPYLRELPPPLGVCPPPPSPAWGPPMQQHMRCRGWAPPPFSKAIRCWGGTSQPASPPGCPWPRET